MIPRIEGFDEASYLRSIPGLAEAIQGGAFAFGLQHYLYFNHAYRLTGVLAGFDEAAYLEANPDVAQAVARGDIRSGEQHFLLHGAAEHRPGTSIPVPAASRTLLDYFSPGIDPPPHLRERISNSTDLFQFHRLGRIVGFEVSTAIAERVDLVHGSRILDFGCGCGRVAQYVKRLYPECQLHGTDVDREAVAWCQGAIPNVARFDANAPVPPLDYPAGHFDVAYAISIFTHLPEDLEQAWLQELNRVTKPGGLLLLTTHGPELFAANDYAREQKDSFQQSGFSYITGQETSGLPDFYRLSFHHKDYIERRWAGLFAHVEFIPQGIAKHQDLVVCRTHARSE